MPTTESEPAFTVGSRARPRQRFRRLATSACRAPRASAVAANHRHSMIRMVHQAIPTKGPIPPVPPIVSPARVRAGSFRSTRPRQSIVMDHRRLFLPLVVVDRLPSAACDREHRRRRMPLERSRYWQPIIATFVENFANISTSRPPDRGRDGAPTRRGHGDFGDAQFTDPDAGLSVPDGQFGILRIEARKDAAGHLAIGTDQPRAITTVRRRQRLRAACTDTSRSKAMLPTGHRRVAGLLAGRHRRQSRAPRSTCWNTTATRPTNIAPPSMCGPTTIGSSATARSFRSRQKAPSSSQFNRYGVRIERGLRDLLSSIARRCGARRHGRSIRQPMYMLANLALGSGWPIDKVIDPTFMYIKSIAAYQQAQLSHPARHQKIKVVSTGSITNAERAERSAA